MASWSTNILLIILIAVTAAPYLTAEDTAQAVELPGRTTQLLASIDSELDRLNDRTATDTELDDKLDESTFTSEDFAQETTLTTLLDVLKAVNTTSTAVKTNTAGNQNQTDDIARLIGENGRSVDAFDRLVVKNTRTLVSIPGHDPYSPERQRILVNDSRQLLMYNESDAYNKTTDIHQLTPQEATTVTYESAESPPYFVAYETQSSWAFSLNRSLQPGDFARVGWYRDDHGYFIEHNGAHGALEADLVVLRNGQETRRRSITLKKPFTEFTRLVLNANWYNAGEQRWIQTYTNLSLSDVQRNDVIGYTATEGDHTMGPATALLPTRFEVHRGAGNDPLLMNAGSTAILLRGDVDIPARTKTRKFTQPVNVTGTWQPIAALRIDPDDMFVRAELTDIDLAETEANEDVYIMARQHSPTLVQFAAGSANWRYPNTTTPDNSVIQYTDNVVKAPNRSGNVLLNTPQPGGFQLGWGSLYSSGNKGSASADATQALKRPFYGSDVTVVWVFVENEGNPSLPTDVTVEYVIEQDY